MHSPPDEPTTPHPLEPSRSELEQWFGDTLKLLLDHLDSLDSQPAMLVEGAIADAEKMDGSLPEEGSDAREVIRTVVEDLVPRSFNSAGPSYLAYVPGGGIPVAALADLISNLTNRYVGVYAAAPLLARLEVNALRWLMDLMDYPEEARGIFTSGGSLANFSAIICARHKLLGEEFQDGVIYCSDQVHHCMTKAALLAGFPRRRIQRIATGSIGRLDPAAVRERVAEDRRSQLRPALLVASAGTVNTGMVDPLDALADVAQEEGLWFHVDAAYGGFFQMTARGRQVFRGLGRADSIAMDPHKGMFLPYGTGCLMVRDGEILRNAHSSEGEYLPAMQRGSRAQDFCEYSPELSRGFRGLRVWLPLKIMGLSAFRQCLDEKLDLTQWAWNALRQEPCLEVTEKPELSLFAFWIRGDAPDGPLTQQLLDRIHAHKKTMLSATVWNGRYVLRICVLMFRLHARHMEQAVKLIVDEARRRSD